MQKEFNITHILLNVTDGPNLKIPVSYTITVEVRQWKERRSAKFISSTACPDEFRFEGDSLELRSCSDNKFVTLSVTFGLLEQGGTFGGMSFLTDTQVPDKFNDPYTQP